LVSSTGKTDADGRFEIFLPQGRSSIFDLRIAPGPGVKAPWMVRKGVRPTPTAGTRMALSDAIRYPAMPNAVKYRLPVAGFDASGGRKAAIGATVTFSSTLLSSPT